MLVIPTMIAPKIADQNPATWKLSSIAATRPNIAAFNTKINNPSVTTVSGNVIKKNNGRTTALTSPRSNAASMKLPVPSIQTPGNKREARNRPSIVIKVRSRMPCIPHYGTKIPPVGKGGADRGRHLKQRKGGSLRVPLVCHVRYAWYGSNYR